MHFFETQMMLLYVNPVCGLEIYNSLFLSLSLLYMHTHCSTLTHMACYSLLFNKKKKNNNPSNQADLWQDKRYPLLRQTSAFNYNPPLKILHTSSQWETNVVWRWDRKCFGGVRFAITKGFLSLSLSCVSLLWHKLSRTNGPENAKLYLQLESCIAA